MRPVLTGLLMAISLPTAAMPSGLVPRLERQLAAGGVESVNAHLAAQWSSAMVPLNRLTAECDFQAVGLAVRLSRTGHVRSAQAHQDALRAAVGKCTAFVLALAEGHDVPKWCSSSDHWTVMQTVRELRRRMAAIEADPALYASPAGKACRDAYHHELHNTRVVLRSASKEAPR